MEKVKIEIHTSDFPQELQEIFTQTEVYDTSCHSGATVLYCDKGYYIKIDGKGNTVSTYSKHTFKIISTGEVNMRNMTLDCYQQQSVIQVNSQVTVNLSDI